MAFHRFSLQTFSLVLDCSECGGWLGPFDGRATGEQCGAAQVVDPGDWGPEAVQPLNFQQPRSCKSLSNVWMWRLGSYCPEIRAKRWRFDMWQLCISIRNTVPQPGHNPSLHQLPSSAEVSARKLGRSPRRSVPVSVGALIRIPKTVT